MTPLVGIAFFLTLLQRNYSLKRQSVQLAKQPKTDVEKAEADEATEGEGATAMPGAAAVETPGEKERSEVERVEGPVK